MHHGRSYNLERLEGIGLTVSQFGGFVDSSLNYLLLE